MQIHYSKKAALLSTLLLVFMSVPLITNALTLTGLILAVPGFLLYLAAGLFDASIDQFVFHMGGNIGNLGLGASIELIWTIVRDLVNLTFIFGLVYVGIKTILSAGTDTKKMLAGIIIAALLVNFSLFISKVVIDVANISAVEIYTQMGLTEATTDTRYSLSERFIAQMGIYRLVAVPDRDGTLDIESFVTGPDVLTGDDFLIFAVGASIFILVASFVFAAGAILLAIRFAVLIIVMMLSPIAFAAQVFPVFAGWSKWWWKSLLSQSFFAPAYLFMLYITLQIGNGYIHRTEGFEKIYSGGIADFERGFETMAYFVITTVMLVASIVVAKKMGAYGASTALNVGNKARQYGQRAVGSSTFGLAARAGRGTIGAGASRLKDSEKLQRMAARGGVHGLLGRSIVNTADKTAGASFDARQAGGVGKKLDIGEGKKGGYTQTLKDIEKKELKTSKMLGATDESIFEGAGERIKNMHTEVKEKEKNRQDAYTRLSQETDPAKRTKIAAQINELTSEIDGIKKDEGYKKTKDAAEKSFQRQYAANLEKRGDNITPKPLRMGYRMFIRSKRENKKAAATVRKDVGKEKADKQNDSILDALSKDAKDG